MFPIHSGNTSSSSSDSSSAKTQKNLISSDEITIENFDRCIDDFRLTQIQKDHVYKTPRLNLFTSDYVIRTEERNVQIKKADSKIELLSPTSIAKHKEEGFRYIHIGLVQVGVKPLNREGLNTSILATLRDKRFRNFKDSLLGTVESSLYKGPISFDCYPNFTVSLEDTNLLKSLVLDIQTHNYVMEDGSIPIALIFKVHYKAMMSAFKTKSRYHSKKGETLLLQTDMTRSNVVIPQPIQWNQVTLPPEWILEGATESDPKHIEKVEPNTQLKNVTQF